MAPIFGVAVQGKIKTTTIRYFLFLKDICVLTHSSVANFSRIFVSSPIHPLPISQGYLCPHPFIRCQFLKDICVLTHSSVAMQRLEDLVRQLLKHPSKSGNPAIASLSERAIAGFPGFTELTLTCCQRSPHQSRHRCCWRQGRFRWRLQGRY